MALSYANLETVCLHLVSKYRHCRLKFSQLGVSYVLIFAPEFF